VMSRATQEKTHREEAASPPSPAPDTRIDAAHSIAVGAENPPDGLAAEVFLPPIASASTPEEAEEQLHRQAAQLAEYLRTRQRELDHRESRLNAEIAQLESEARAARLWLREREVELHERQNVLAGGERVVVQRLNRLAAAENALRRRRKGNTGVSEGTFEGDGPVFPSQKSGSSPGSPAGQSELARLRGLLLEERRRFDEEVRDQRRRVAAAEQQALGKVEKKRQGLRRRSEHLDRCRAALRRLHGELQQRHRETLEVRLAAEELWIQLAGSAPPAGLTLALERARSRLADQYRLAGAELLEQKQELESLRGELAAQCEAFTAQKKRYEQWAATRQQQLEIQARRLVAREQELEELRRASLLQTLPLVGQTSS
jgi:septal ring factor EnvC (AmiA/AmiB activator)